MFQSLFFWNSRPDVYRWWPIILRRRVSILVFLELAPGLQFSDGSLAVPFCFNPCFSGTRARTRLRDEYGAISDVSILVFLELAPGPRGVRASRSMFRRVSILVFLELAPGQPEQGRGAAAYRFQSLFFWNSRPDSERRLPSRSGYQFQSLFFWNSRPDSIDHGIFISRWIGFNPCFSGTRARTRVGRRKNDEEKWFQSLFFWNSRPDARRGFVRKRI